MGCKPMKNDTLAELALRKELLQKRSSYYRLQIAQEIVSIKKSISWTPTNILTSWPAKSLFWALALRHIGHSRIARVLSLSSRAILVAQVATQVFKLYRSRSPATADEPMSIEH
jgi:hypothetical protein